MPKAPASTTGPAGSSSARSRVPTSVGLAVAAASGFGKTTLLERLALEPGALFLPSDDAQRRTIDGGRRDTLATPEGEPLRHLIIDDFDCLRPPEQLRLMQHLGELDRGVAISIASRVPLLDDLRNRLQRPMVDYTPVDLCLDAQEVADTLAQDYDVDDSVAERVHHLTAGWPELVHLTGLALRATSAAASLRAESLQRHLLSPSAPIAAWCQSEVLDTLPPDALRALRLASWLGPVAHELICEVDRATGDGAAVPGLAWLEQVGMVLPAQHAWRAEITMGRVVPLLAAVVRVAQPPPPHGDLDVAARWYAAHELPLPAAHAWKATGDTGRCRQTLIEHGNTILGSGGASELIALAGGVEDAPRALQLLVGEALRMTGDMTGAHRTLTSAVPDPAARDAALAWRLGMVHYARADYSGAVDVCQRPMDDLEPTTDGVRVLATRACARFMLGQQVAGEQDADRALELAAELDDDRAVAAARLASGMVSTGARRDDHLAAALLAAQRSGDANMAARVLLNQAGNLLVDADFREAAEVAARAVEAAGWGSPPATRACATHNLGEALTRLGKFQDAAVAFRRSVRIYRSHGLARTPAAMWGLAEIDRQRGRLDEARAAYAEVVDLASDTGEMQVLVPALLGWARCLGQAAATTAADDESTSPGLTAELDLLTRANATAQGCTLQVFAPALRTISGWLALCEGDRGSASSQAAEAIEAARGQRNRAALADALELMAAVAHEDRVRRSALIELEAIWRSGGANPAADQVLVRLAGLPGAEPALRADAKAALRRLTTAGVRVPGSGPDEAEPASSVSVRVLGSFEVRVNGREVPHAAWRSRQARSLLKILAAARGRPLTRDHLCEALWPDDLSDKTGHRLSVLLSAVRNVLDPDRRCASDHYLRTDLDAVRLDLRHVRLDLEELLRDAREADALARRGQQHRALELLAEVEAGYRGEAFEDEPYEQWAEIPREEARAAWSGATRLAARLARRSGQADLAVGHLVRLLSSDPYDADVHRTLVDLLLEAGRHGEARRRLELWAKAMHEIGAPHPDHRLANAGNTDQAKRSRPRAAERALGRRADPLLTPR